MSGGQGGPRFRLLDDGHIEIEGQGVPRKTLPPRVNEWRREAYAAQDAYGIPAHLIAGVIGLESGGKPNIVTSDGGWGLMMITSPVLKAGYTKEQVLDPPTNVMIGTKYLKLLWGKYGGNLVQVLAAYNAGGAYPGGGCQTRDPTTKACTSRCTPNPWNLVGACSGGKTLDYPGIIIGYANDALDHGFPADGSYRPTDFAKPARASAWPLLVLLGLGSAAYVSFDYHQRTGEWTP